MECIYKIRTTVSRCPSSHTLPLKNILLHKLHKGIKSFWILLCYKKKVPCWLLNVVTIYNYACCLPANILSTNYAELRPTELLKIILRLIIILYWWLPNIVRKPHNLSFTKNQITANRNFQNISIHSKWTHENIWTLENVLVVFKELLKFFFLKAFLSYSSMKTLNPTK